MKLKKLFALAMMIFFLAAVTSAEVEASKINLPSKKVTEQKPPAPKPAEQKPAAPTPPAPKPSEQKPVTPPKVEDNREEVLKKSVWQPEIRIGLFSGAAKVELQMSAPCVIIDPDTKQTIKKVAKDESFTITPSNMKAAAVEVRGEKVQLKDLIVTINGKKYFGGVRVNNIGGTLRIINLAPVEEYLRGVLPSEMMPSFNIEALKVQAVAARSYTLKNRGRHESEGYDLCATTHCQKYDGVSVVHPSTDKAVRETRGEVLYYRGAYVDTNFHTDSGGMTENVEDVWGSKAPYLVAVRELNTETRPWSVKFSASDFSARMGSEFGTLKGIKLTKLTVGKSAADRSASGRVKLVELVGSKKVVKLSGGDLRTKFSLPSTLFDIKFEDGNVTFNGFGSGHGVGMSQYGAEAFAKAGWKYEKILKHYYTDTEIKKLY